jgi:hypothetical protein
VDVGNVYGDLTGRFTILSSKGHQYILTLYDYNSNIVSTKPMKTKSDKKMIRAYTALHQQLLNAGLKPELQIMDNECSRALIQYLTEQNIALQLVPPTPTPVEYSRKNHSNVQKSFCGGALLSRQTVPHAFMV